MRTFGLLTWALASAQEGDETAYLLQTRTQQQKSGEVDDCYVSGGCVTTTTTEAPTTTTARPTRPATTTPRPTRPATTTTEATTPFVGEVIAPPPVGRVVLTPPGEEPPNHNSYCDSRLGTVLAMSKPTINNLGGMGPTPNRKKEMRYDKVTTKADGSSVHLIITTPDSVTVPGPAPRTSRFSRFSKPSSSSTKSYHSQNEGARAFSTDGKSFIAKYNGGGARGRSDVMAIGSLAKGDFVFNFAFVDDAGEAVVIPFLPMTFFDLDGSTAREAGGKSYEVVTTNDSAGMEHVVGSKVVDSCTDGVCTANSAKEEIAIPNNFDQQDAETKKAAVTFFFKGKSSFDITYTLNYEHRVFLFKGQCID